MRVLIQVGYEYLLLGAGAQVGAVLQGLDGAVPVREDGYGAEARYVPVAETKLKVTIVDDRDLSLPENQDATIVKEISRLAKELAEANSKLYTANEKIKKHEAAVAALVPKKE